MSATTCWLLLDEIGANFPGVANPDSAPVVVARLAGYRPVAGATEWLRYPDVVVCTLQLFAPSGELLRDLPCGAREPVWTNLPFDRRSDARRLAPAIDPAGPVRERQVPAFLVTEEATGSGIRRHVHCCSRIRESGMLFTRIWAGDPVAGESPVATVRTACAEQPGLLRRFTDESNQMTRFESDVEIELKLTLEQSSSPWGIACQFGAAVQDRRLPGFIPDLGNELQRWTYEQDTFEVLAPADKAGYIAFMTDVDGSYIVKYKFFAEDALRRVETFDLGVRLEPGEFAGYITSKLNGIELRPLPHLVRTRFDVNVESAATGHFFGLEMDEVRAGGHVLQQMEIEYHRTRACYGMDGSRIDPEIFRLADEAQRLLAEWGIKTERGYLSKLTFLRGVAAA